MTPEAGPPVDLPLVYGTAPGHAEQPFAGVNRKTHQTEHATVSAYTFTAGAAFPPHRHPEEQITVVLEGDVELTVAGEAQHLRRGETFAVPGGVEHSLRAGAAGASFLAVVVPRRARSDAYEITGVKP